MTKVKNKKHRSSVLPDDFSDEELVKYWTLSLSDKRIVLKHSKIFRLGFAIQLCSMKMYGRFINNPDIVSVRILNYLNEQLILPPSFRAYMPKREATLISQRKTIYKYLKFSKFGSKEKQLLANWVSGKLSENLTAKELIPLAEKFLLGHNIALPGISVLRRLIVAKHIKSQQNIFENIYNQLNRKLLEQLNTCLNVNDGSYISFFAKLKEYPPHSSSHSIKIYLSMYSKMCEFDLSKLDLTSLAQKTIGHFAQLARRYHADDMKRFNPKKRVTLLICFLIEVRKQLLDHIIAMHDQFIGNMLRRSKHSYNDRLIDYRKKVNSAHNILLEAVEFVIEHEPGKAIYIEELYKSIDEKLLKSSVEDCYFYKKLNENGYVNSLVARYSYLRQYFADFVKLPFSCETGSGNILKAIKLIEKLDNKQIRELPSSAPCGFIPGFMQSSLQSKTGLKRNVWEIGLAIAMRDALRAGNVYLEESKQHVSFWKLIYDDKTWSKEKEKNYQTLNLPKSKGAARTIRNNYLENIKNTNSNFLLDNFATIEKNKLKLTKDDKLDEPPELKRLHKTIESSLPKIRIEQLLMEVDQATNFSQCFMPITKNTSRPQSFYKSLMAAIIAHATNLGTLTMANSTPDISVDQLRHIMDYYIREETIKEANTKIVNSHHLLPWSSKVGTGQLSSSDGQRFRLQASSLLGALYPRYYGYYDHAVGIYTHVSDQFSVFGTKIISCSPREAIYVLDGLLENNTILKNIEHTTDTAGFTEHIFALCYLLGFYFMPRIRDLKKQQLYYIDKSDDLGIFNAIIRKKADLLIIEEQWDEMVRVAASIEQRITPAHVIVLIVSLSSLSNFVPDKMCHSDGRSTLF